jgi:hypothetical protein
LASKDLEAHFKRLRIMLRTVCASLVSKAVLGAPKLLLQELQHAEGFEVLRGHSHQVGTFSVRGHAQLSSSSGASVSMVSLPLQQVHQMHDVAKQAALVRYYREAQKDPKAGFTHMMDSMLTPQGNVVLLQVLSQNPTFVFVCVLCLCTCERPHVSILALNP